MEKRHYRRALTIAGSDSGGGAGIQADLKTFSALGCYGMSVITAVTAQNTTGVSDIHPVPVINLQKQITAVIVDIGVDAIKIGMLHSSEVIRAVADNMDTAGTDNIVLDPVMVATSGDQLLLEEAIKTLVQVLIPKTKLITPNIPEAQILLGRKLTQQGELPQAARDLAGLGCRAVMLKAGHLNKAELIDIFYDSHTGETMELSSHRLTTRNNHGTGCTLSSAIAAYLARGEALNAAVRKAKVYLTAALEAGAKYEIGHGHGPVHHFHKFWS